MRQEKPHRASRLDLAILGTLLTIVINYLKGAQGTIVTLEERPHGLEERVGCEELRIINRHAWGKELNCYNCFFVFILLVQLIKLI
jgi:hypothetical protein